MKLIICFSAPAVIESIATTAPTPKIMPSMVSRLRSLCARRLDSPMASSGRYPEIGLFILTAPLRSTCRNARHRGALFLALLVAWLGGGVRQCNHFTGFEPVRNHHGRFAAPGKLYRPLLKTAAALDPYGWLAIFFEDGLCRNVDGV